MKKFLLAVICVLALVLGMAYILWQDGTKPNYGLIPFVLLGLALAIGAFRRLLVARCDGNTRQGLAPLRDAGTTYGNLLLGREQGTHPVPLGDASNHLLEDPGA